jgi:hypothetical protein
MLSFNTSEKYMTKNKTLHLVIIAREKFVWSSKAEIKYTLFQFSNLFVLENNQVC